MIAQPKHTEARFEDAIELALLARGYVKGKGEAFNAEQGVFPQDALSYVKSSQEQEVAVTDRPSGACGRSDTAGRVGQGIGQQRHAVGPAAWVQSALARRSRWRHFSQPAA